MEIYIVSGVVVGFISALSGLLVWMFRIASKHQNERIDSLISEVTSFQMEIKYLQAQNDAQNYAHQKKNGDGFTKNYTRKLDELLKAINFKRAG